MTDSVTPVRIQTGGPIAWMAQNKVAANLLMVVLLVGGALFASRIKQEVFPEFTADMISISVPYPGASPEEVEQGIVLAIEDNVRGLDGIKKVSATALEGAAAISLELLSGTNSNKALQDVKNAVDRITTFPQEAERPIVSLVDIRKRVLTLMIHGDISERSLRNIAEEIRDELINLDGITLVELGAVKPLEIAIEVPQHELRRYGLTLTEIASIVRQTALELPGGSVKTAGGQILLRTQERRDVASEFLSIPVVASESGAVVRLGDIATIRDGFEEVDEEASFNGQPAAQVNVFRVGDETPISVSDTVKSYLETKLPELPSGVNVKVWDDSSEHYRGRVDLLVRNAQIGLLLVLITLALFLDVKLAFWVTLGIPISILGAFLFIPFFDASINMISLFAFIVTLGIIVDDAVVMGENIYEKRQQGLSYKDAAIEGAREIAGPVVFAVLTNIVAFLPLFFVPGASGKFFRQIPAITVAVFIVSLIESIFVLPAHLSHPKESRGWLLWIEEKRSVFQRGLQRFIDEYYSPLVDRAIKGRYVTIALSVCLLLMTIGFVGGGHIPFTFLPRIDTDLITAQATLPFGTPIERAREVREVLIRSAQKAAEPHGGASILEGVFSQIGQRLSAGGGPPRTGLTESSGAHLVAVQLSLVSQDKRDIGGQQLANLWRKEVGDLVGLESLTFNAVIGSSEGAAIDIQLSHRDRATLEKAANELAGRLVQYAGVTDIEDGVAQGKRQFNYTLLPAGRSMGLTSRTLAEQLRASFFGIEALRQQRGRNEVKVQVKLPETDREKLKTLEDLILIAPNGGEIPLDLAAKAEPGYSYTEIRRNEGRRVISVTADVDLEVGNPNEIVSKVVDKDIPPLLQRYPGLSYSLEGEQASQRESLSSLGIGFLCALLAIYSLLAIPFQSYLQPLIVMVSIPFGIIGAVIGHVLLGYGLNIISMFGLIALSGVVVNDSLVLVVTVNALREKGMSLQEAAKNAGIRRFRPIILTSLTTFFGLAPMIFETSLQARFLIPMAISIGCGILFATAIILLLVPAIYVALEDLEKLIASKRESSHIRSVYS